MLLIFSCPADHVPDWQPHTLLSMMVETRSVNVKNTHTREAQGARVCNKYNWSPFGKSNASDQLGDRAGLRGYVQFNKTHTYKHILIGTALYQNRGPRSFVCQQITLRLFWFSGRTRGLRVSHCA